MKKNGHTALKHLGISWFSMKLQIWSLFSAQQKNPCGNQVFHAGGHHVFISGIKSKRN